MTNLRSKTHVTASTNSLSLSTRPILKWLSMALAMVMEVRMSHAVRNTSLDKVTAIKMGTIKATRLQVAWPTAIRMQVHQPSRSTQVARMPHHPHQKKTPYFRCPSKSEHQVMKASMHERARSWSRIICCLHTITTRDLHSKPGKYLVFQFTQQGSCWTSFTHWASQSRLPIASSIHQHSSTSYLLKAVISTCSQHRHKSHCFHLFWLSNTPTSRDHPTTKSQLTINRSQLPPHLILTHYLPVHTASSLQSCSSQQSPLQPLSSCTLKSTTGCCQLSSFSTCWSHGS